MSRFDETMRQPSNQLRGAQGASAHACLTGLSTLTSVSALFSVSCVVRGAAFRLLVVVGFTYSPVNPLLLLTGHGIVVSSRRVDGCGSSSSDPSFLFRFPRFSIEVSTCCLKEVPGVGLWGTLSLFGFLWLCHTLSVDPVWGWGYVSRSLSVAPRLRPH